ncbi:MAG: phosphoenolpyruvate mutase [Spirochaetia bacterium]|jgi:phosphoenolpyruvate phosphomutase|nr:phosphoenolpyruvate mutase [Spirochaetia bacterium]
MKKTTRFRKLLESDTLEFMCEAHNGLSAKIVEEAGFPGIWGSGLSISSQFGVRDSNEASWTQVLEVLEFMSDVTTVPILLDGDTGYGNFNNMRRLVRKLEQRKVAAVCIEDKLFPKTNSFVRGTAQPLADMEEFCGKIKAGKDAQGDDEFSIIARVEAFIAGWGLKEALRRAEAYHKAGADGILIHSALGVADEVLAFKKEWGGRSPVLIVPTKYYSTPTGVFRDYGFSVLIWANQILRSAIRAMQKTAGILKSEETLTAVEDKIAPVKEVFRLQGMDELETAERLYLPRQGENTAVVILAAARGKDLGVLTENKPKAMVEIAGQPLLAHIADAYNAAGLKDITVVRGYKKDTVNLPNLAFADNDAYADTGELYSLKAALDTIREPRDLIIAYGDVLVRKYILQILLESAAPFTIIADTNWQEGVNRNRFADYVECSEALSRRTFNSVVTLKRVSTPADILECGRIHGEWVGALRVTADKFAVLRSTLDGILCEPKNRNAEMGYLMNALVRRGEAVRVLYTTGGWLDIDSVEDILLAGSFA